MPGFRAGGLSILWSIFALTGVVEGIRHDTRFLRLTGLALFAVVALKVYFSDLGHLGAVSKVIALVILGGIVLCGSLIYLRNLEAFRTSAGEATGDAEKRR